MDQGANCITHQSSWVQRGSLHASGQLYSLCLRIVSHCCSRERRGSYLEYYTCHTATDGAIPVHRFQWGSSFCQQTYQSGCALWVTQKFFLSCYSGVETNINYPTNLSFGSFIRSSADDMDTKPNGRSLRGSTNHFRLSFGSVPKIHQLLDDGQRRDYSAK